MSLFLYVLPLGAIGGSILAVAGLISVKIWGPL
jgi:hypothetical protein